MQTIQKQWCSFVHFVTWCLVLSGGAVVLCRVLWSGVALWAFWCVWQGVTLSAWCRLCGVSVSGVVLWLSVWLSGGLLWLWWSLIWLCVSGGLCGSSGVLCVVLCLWCCRAVWCRSLLWWSGVLSSGVWSGV